MKIKYYCPECKSEKTIDGITNNIKALWEMQFGESYDFYKTNEEIEQRNRWAIERIKILKEMDLLNEKIAKLEDRLYKNKDFRDIKMLYQELNFLNQRFQYRDGNGGLI